jgi:hypothetical protein
VRNEQHSNVDGSSDGGTVERGIMAEIISCPSCQRKLQVPETLAGQDVQCPTCGATFVARVGGAVPASDRASQAASERWEDRRPDSGRASAEPWPQDDRGPYDQHAGYDRPYDDYARRRRDLTPHRGALILCLGVIGLVVFPLLCPIAWIMGNADMAEIRAGRMDREGEGLTQGGRVCGIIGTVLYGLMVCGCGFVMCSAMMAPHH